MTTFGHVHTDNLCSHQGADAGPAAEEGGAGVRAHTGICGEAPTSGRPRAIYRPMATARNSGQPMASSPSLGGVATAARAMVAAQREPPGLVFWSAGLGPQAPRKERAPGTRRDAPALTARLVESAKDRHCLSVGPHYRFPDWGWMALLPVSLQGSRQKKTTATRLKCYLNISSQQASEVGAVLASIL